VPRIDAFVTGSVWKIECSVGDEVADGDVLILLESMKMEIPVEAEQDGRVTRSFATRARRSRRANHCS
jgi:acetyl-CoA carboxylase biotin carboxyl carrier protein